MVIDMVLTHDKIEKIEELVFERPRNISELSKLLHVSWKTANRYINTIRSTSPNISIHVFKSGTRGGLKIVYWKNNKISPISKQQEVIIKEIKNAKSKTDFSPFDIYQFADENMRKAFWEEKSCSTIYTYGTEDINKLLKSAKYEYLSFSGDFSWTLQKEKGSLVLKTLENLAKRNISIKMLGRVEFSNINNVEQLLTINKKSGREMISIRHINQPLRGAVIDDNFIRLTENFKFDNNKSRFVFYEINDPVWVKFLKSVFWRIYDSSIPAEKRLNDLKTFSKRRS